jgi:hypothetical protein
VFGNLGGRARSYSSTASGGAPQNALDGNTTTMWNSGGTPTQWVQIDLGRPSPISKVRLLPSVYPSSAGAVHEIWGGATTGSLSLLKTVTGSHEEGVWREWMPSAAVKNIRYLKVVTTSIEGGSWVAWREIEVYKY